MEAADWYWQGAFPPYLRMLPPHDNSDEDDVAAWSDEDDVAPSNNEDDEVPLASSDSRLISTPSRAFGDPNKLPPRIPDLVQFGSRDYSLTSISSGPIKISDGAITIGGPVRLEYNTAREQCPNCKAWFRDRAMLERHYKDIKRTCTRCKKVVWATCTVGSDVWSKNPCCIFGCDKAWALFSPPRGNASSC